MKAGWRDAPLALRDSVVSKMQEICNHKNYENFEMGIANNLKKIPSFRSVTLDNN